MEPPRGFGDKPEVYQTRPLVLLNSTPYAIPNYSLEVRPLLINDTFAQEDVTSTMIDEISETNSSESVSSLKPGFETTEIVFTTTKSTAAGLTTESVLVSSTTAKSELARQERPKMLIIACISIVAFLFIVTICALYMCLKKYCCTTKRPPKEKSYSASDRRNPPLSGVVINSHRPANLAESKSTYSYNSQSTIPLMQNAVDQSLSQESVSPAPAKSIPLSSHHSKQRLGSSRVHSTSKSTIGSTGKRNLSKQSAGKDVKRKKSKSKSKSARPKKHDPDKITRQPSARHKTPSSMGNQPLIMDKATITADMFKPHNTSKSKKEIVLFKAASFTE